MKRIFPIFFILALLPTLLSAREIVRLTRFDGQPIRGVSANHMFQVELIRSDQTKAVVELDAELESFLRFELKPGGIVSVDLVLPKNDQRRIERGNDWKNKTIRLALYLPEFTAISLADMSQLQSNDNFSGEIVRIKMEDMAKITRLSLNAEDVEIKAEDMSSVDMTLHTQKVGVKSDDMAKIVLRGSALKIQAESNDMSRFNGEEFHTQRAELRAADMAKISVRVDDYLYARASDIATISHTGEPRTIDLKTPSRTIYRKNE